MRTRAMLQPLTQRPSRPKRSLVGRVATETGFVGV
jgi:hypothetical protein